MADNLVAKANTGTGTDVLATDEIGGVHYPRTKLVLGDNGTNDGDVSDANPLPVSGPLTDAQLRAAAIPVSGPVTDAQMRAAPVTVTGPLTDTQLRAVALPVAGPLTDAELRAADVPVSGPLTDAELRLAAVVVSATDLATIAAATALEDDPASSGDRGMVILGMRRDADTTTASNDGDYTALKMDEVGRLKVAAQPGRYDLVTGAITANGQTAFVECSRGSNIIAHVVATSLVGHNVTFEGSIDSTNGTDGAWFAIQAIRTNANTIELVTGVLAATPGYGWEFSVNGLKYIRVRATTHTSGTATWKFQQAPYATEPIPAAQVSATQPVSGSITTTPAIPTTTGCFVNSAASTNGTIIKASAGNIYSLVVTNTNAAVRYLKIYNSATVTVGTTVPVLTIAIPALGVANIDFGAQGLRFTTGICIAMTTGPTDGDTGAVAAAEIKLGISYI